MIVALIAAIAVLRACQDIEAIKQMLKLFIREAQPEAIAGALWG